MSNVRDAIAAVDFKGAEYWPMWICRRCQKECEYYLVADICDQCGAQLEEQSDEHSGRVSEPVSQSR